jgi:hypothetical protein
MIDGLPLAPSITFAKDGMMGRIITLDIPEEIFDKVKDTAGVRGLTPADWIVDRIAEELDQPRSGREMSPPGGSVSKSALEADERLMRMLGSFDSGDPHSADNDRIDADLAREYGAGLGEQE